jgi:hypothetical protein
VWRERKEGIGTTKDVDLYIKSRRLEIRPCIQLFLFLSYSSPGRKLRSVPPQGSAHFSSVDFISSRSHAVTSNMVCWDHLQRVTVESRSDQGTNLLSGEGSLAVQASRLWCVPHNDIVIDRRKNKLTCSKRIAEIETLGPGPGLAYTTLGLLSKKQGVTLNPCQVRFEAL